MWYCIFMAAMVTRTRLNFTFMLTLPVLFDPNLKVEAITLNHTACLATFCRKELQPNRPKRSNLWYVRQSSVTEWLLVENLMISWRICIPLRCDFVHPRLPLPQKEKIHGQIPTGIYFQRILGRRTPVLPIKCYPLGDCYIRTSWRLRKSYWRLRRDWERWLLFCW